MVRNLIIMWVAFIILNSIHAWRRVVGQKQMASVSAPNCSSSVSCRCNSTSSRCTAFGSGIVNGSRSRSNASCECSFAEYVTQNSEQLAEFIHSNYNRVVYILTLAISCLLLMVILIILSPYRRHSRNRFLIGAVQASQVLPFTIIAYTLGLMHSPPYHNSTYAIWAMLCLLIHGISSTRIHRIQDKQQERNQALKEAKLLYLASWSMYLHHTGGMLQAPLISILGVAFLKFIFGLIQTYSPSCRLFGLRRRVKLVADFMSFEHELGEGSPSSMEGYKYLVKGEENISELISNKEECRKNPQMINQRAVTVERIWQCNSRFLNCSEGKQLKDKCLSFAMFRLLLMRFNGFSSHKKHRSKNWALVCDELLSKQNKHQRAFQVVEDELSFLYDYFFTQYPLIFSDGKFFVARTTIYALLELAQFVAGLCIIIALANSGEFSIHRSRGDYFHVYKFCKDRIWSDFADYDCNHVPAVIHFFGACIFVVLYVVLQIFQLLEIVLSDWAMVWLLCEYVERPRWTLESLLRFVCRWKLNPSRPWKRKMGQYYLLSSYNYSAFVARRGQECHDSKELDMRMMSDVIDSFMENGCQLTNGSSFLRRNNIETLSWECRLTSTTERILVWHVATSLCIMELEYHKASEGNESGETKQKREFAECLSGYCAYLVASVPALLPSPTQATEVTLDKAILEASEILGSCRDRRAVYSKLKDSGGDKGVRGVVRMGAELGIELLSDVNKPRRWKVLLDFWTEMTLFLAASNNPTAHAVSLKNGGEIITVLWALLTHVGFTRNTGAEDGTQPSDAETAEVPTTGHDDTASMDDGTCC